MESLRVVALPVSVRRPGLDTLRVLAMLLVVMLHAGIPYTVAELPGLTWPVRHTATSPLIDALFWGVEVMIMPLFFLLSGYGAAQSLRTKPDQFLPSRWRRLGRPLVGAAIVLLPIELYLWMLGWAADDRLSLGRLISVKLGPLNHGLWGLSHLWYLEYLLLYSTMFWAGSRFLNTFQSSMAETLLRSVAKVETFFLLTAAVLWIAPEVVVGFQHSFFPVPAKFFFSGLFFAAGVAECHQPTRWTWPATTSYLMAGILLLSLLPLIHQQAASPLIGHERIVLALGLAACAVLMLQTVWQQALSVARPIPPLMDYLSRASFWTYLVHHPLVAIWHIGLRTMEWPAMMQFIVCTLGTVAMSLASYEVLVRRTRLGAFLEGRGTASLPQPAAPAAVPLRRAA